MRLDPEPDHHAVLAPGQIGETAFVPAVGARGRLAAQWARRGAGARGQGEDDGGRAGLERPSFEPDRNRIRQQTRENVHPTDMVTLRRRSPKAAKNPTMWFPARKAG